MNSLNLYNLISENIKRERIKKGMTQKELAERTGYSYAYIRRIEGPRCQKNFSILTIYNICECLNIDISELFK